MVIGQTLGPYEVLAKLGEGGMGEVYRAKDTRLGREVAIKILPEAFALDVDRLTRFEREAQVLAALNHPHIAQIYSFETETLRRSVLDTREGNGPSASGVGVGPHASFLVMELVEGETLAERLKRGPLALEHALRMALQIADALEGAHEKGIVHRDLKPANIKIAPDEKIKVLDFGLAKAMEPAGASGASVPHAAGLTHSPTISVMATQAGVILGTAGYMSPEQAKGESSDARSDLFSFGCVLYEMLTGRQTFQAASIAETMAAVLMREADFSLLPANVTPTLAELLRRCLEKNPRQRWQAVGDLRVELERVAANPRAAAHASLRLARPLWKRAVPIAATAVIFTVAGVFGASWRRPVPSPPIVTRFPLVLADDVQFSRSAGPLLAISPDGTRLAYTANQQLFVRSMWDSEFRPVPGTEHLDPAEPFFSPDGQSVGFVTVSDGAIKKIAVNGGAPVTLYKFSREETRIGVRYFQGGSWSGDQILFAQGGKGIMRVPASGGVPQVVVPLKESEQAYGSQILPGGTHVLFALATEDGADRWDNAQIVVQSLTTGERKVLVQGGGAPQYINTGHIVYAIGTTLLAIPFDVKTMAVRGGPVPLIEGIRRATQLAASGAAQFAVSSTGTLVYLPASATTGSQRILALADRQGTIEPLSLPPLPYRHPRVSPDGRQIAFETNDGANSMVWLSELKVGAAARRFTFGGQNAAPTWSRDGRYVIFQSDREGDRGLFRQPADGGPAERLTKADRGIAHRAEDVTPDGRTLSFTADGDLWTVALDGGSQPKPLVRMPSSERYAAFSRDGRWFAYTSNEVGGRDQVFVQAFPPTGAKYQISTNGGRAPLWSPDGKELFYGTVTDGGDEPVGNLVSVPVRTAPTFSFGSPVPVSIRQVFLGDRYYDFTPDGKQFIVVMRADAQAGANRVAAEQIHVVLNWSEELKQRVPMK